MERKTYRNICLQCFCLRGRHKARPLQLAMVWCEAGTRRGRYNWRWFGARPAQGTATTTGDGLVLGRHKARPLQLAMVWCEAGTRHGHYNWRWFGARPAQGAATTTDVVWCGRTNERPYRLSEFRLKPGINQGMHVCSSVIVS